MSVEAKKYKRAPQSELKRPPTAFLMFRAAKGFKDPKEASEAWKSLPQDEKEDFEARFKDAFDEYKNAQAQWEYTHGTSYPTRREKPARPEGIPKRPLSAFLAFRRDRGLRNVVEAGQAWRELPPDEKGVYEAHTMQEMAAYKAAVRVWKDANPGAKLFERKSSKKKAAVAAAAAAEEDLEEEEEDYDVGEDAIADKPKRGRKPLAPGAPRPPPTAWVDYLHNSGKTRKEASEEWKNMSEDAKRPWVRRYEAQKAFYLQQKAIWEANQGLGVMEGLAPDGWDEEPLEDEDGAPEEDELAGDIAPKLPFGYPADY
ncbi:hypothetical protein M427DRAFT_259395 [Gonapodya prolifera JEL478]|uniref:HMG box domain-containing protein n=1 Tax=Gonapodya prolifera (strain JEL478) TaxID=1344416 RepID=A0A139AKK5_GONPJ|nr:hypothetical protein M427DRAFT_259395 [Gonapodya prolifera JEL478]|eukprot:KXS17321.1 hypothetical protein M427DRAFT_259395 [Gonapodya prolifera JEL478]